MLPQKSSPERDRTVDSYLNRICQLTFPFVWEKMLSCLDYILLLLILLLLILLLVLLL
jgi:hypothetical protein